MPLRAILFDFDGVIAHTEPLHLALFQEVLATENIQLSRNDYFENYLGFDDRGCFEAVFKANGRELSRELRDSLIQEKNKRYIEKVQTPEILLSGVKENIPTLSEKYFITVVSGALRSEIEVILKSHQLEKYFKFIVSAEDVSQGKPSPEGYLQAMRRLNRDFVPTSEYLFPQESLVIEDSPWGIEAGNKAGALCIGLSTSYPAERLKQAGAKFVYSHLQDVNWNEVASLFA